MRNLISTVLLLFTGIGFAAQEGSDEHLPSILAQFQRQCMNATNNKPMCQCSVEKFKDQIPPHEVRLGHHASNVSSPVLQIREDLVKILALEVAECEELNPKPHQGDNCLSALEAPELKLATDGLNVTATWNAVEHAANYTLHYESYPDRLVSGQIKMGEKTSFSADLSLGAAFYVEIQAYNDTCLSKLSNTKYFLITHSSPPI